MFCLCLTSNDLSLLISVFLFLQSVLLQGTSPSVLPFFQSRQCSTPHFLRFLPLSLFSVFNRVYYFMSSLTFFTSGYSSDTKKVQLCFFFRSHIIHHIFLPVPHFTPSLCSAKILSSSITKVLPSFVQNKETNKTSKPPLGLLSFSNLHIVLYSEDKNLSRGWQL